LWRRQFAEKTEKKYFREPGRGGIASKKTVWVVVQFKRRVTTGTGEARAERGSKRTAKRAGFDTDPSLLERSGKRNLRGGIPLDLFTNPNRKGGMLVKESQG